MAVALGDEREGARVPVRTDRGETYLEHEGEVVWSKADFDDLRRVAQAGSGSVFERVGRQNFVPVGTKNFDLGEVYRNVVLPAIDAQEQLESETIPLPPRAHDLRRRRACAVVDRLRPPRCAFAAPRNGRTEERTRGSRMSRFGTTLTIWLLLATAAQVSRADSPRDLIRQGNEDYAAGRFAEALEAYQQAAGESTDTPSAELLHNEAAAQFKLGNVDEARELWVPCPVAQRPGV